MQLLNECPLPLINAKGAKMSVETHITVSHQAMRPSQHPRHITRAALSFSLLSIKGSYYLTPTSYVS